MTDITPVADITQDSTTPGVYQVVAPPLWVAFGANVNQRAQATIVSSDGGLTWTVHDPAFNQSGSAANVMATAAGGVIFTARGSVFYGTDDGYTVLPSVTPLGGAATYGGMDVARDGSDRLVIRRTAGTSYTWAVSTDLGATWTQGSKPFSVPFKSVVWGQTPFGPRFVAVTTGNNSSSRWHTTSEDGITWTTDTRSPHTGYYSDWGAGVFSDDVAGKVVICGSDGRLWTPGATATSPMTLLGQPPGAAIIMGGVRHKGVVIVTDNLGKLYVTSDYSSWTTLTPAGATGNEHAIQLASDGERVNAISRNGVARTSLDGLTWTTTHTAPSGWVFGPIAVIPYSVVGEAPAYCVTTIRDFGATLFPARPSGAAPHQPILVVDGNFLYTEWADETVYPALHHLSKADIRTGAINRTWADLGLTAGASIGDRPREFYGLDGLCIAADGIMYGTAAGDRMFKITQDGAVSVLAQFTTFQSAAPRGSPSVGGDGKIYTAYTFKPPDSGAVICVVRVDPTTGAWEVVPGTTLSIESTSWEYRGAVGDKAGNTWIIYDPGTFMPGGFDPGPDGNSILCVSAAGAQHTIVLQSVVGDQRVNTVGVFCDSAGQIIVPMTAQYDGVGPYSWVLGIPPGQRPMAEVVYRLAGTWNELDPGPPQPPSGYADGPVGTSFLRRIAQPWDGDHATRGIGQSRDPYIFHFLDTNTAGVENSLLRKLHPCGGVVVRRGKAQFLAALTSVREQSGMVISRGLHLADLGTRDVGRDGAVAGDKAFSQTVTGDIQAHRGR